MILKFILFALGLYIIYKFVFDLVIPIFRTTQKIRRQFGDMQQHMQDQMNAQQEHPQRPSGASSTSTHQQTSRAGDYIDFEEVK
ncbi:MAG TPA: hypothetical protein VL307_16045 [Chitinophagaceae bacterium]|nr:hypothetical protein [Chitinophagaceae bacterium]